MQVVPPPPPYWLRLKLPTMLNKAEKWKKPPGKRATSDAQTASPQPALWARAQTHVEVAYRAPGPLAHTVSSTAYSYAPMAADVLGSIYARWITAFEAYHVELHGITYPMARHYEGRADGPLGMMTPKPKVHSRRGLPYRNPGANCNWQSAHNCAANRMLCFEGVC